MGQLNRVEFEGHERITPEQWEIMTHDERVESLLTICKDPDDCDAYAVLNVQTLPDHIYSQLIK